METYLEGFPKSEMTGTYPQLVELFLEFQKFGSPNFDDRGVPDYTAPAMEAQFAVLRELRLRLDALDTIGWSQTQLVDLHIVRAEMNGNQHEDIAPRVMNS